MEFIEDQETCSSQDPAILTASDEDDACLSMIRQDAFNAHDNTIASELEHNYSMLSATQSFADIIEMLLEDYEEFGEEVLNQEIASIHELNNKVGPIFDSQIEATKKTSKMFSILLAKMWIKHYKGSVAFAEDPRAFQNFLQKHSMKYPKSLLKIPDCQTILTFGSRDTNRKEIIICWTIRWTPSLTHCLYLSCLTPESASVLDFTRCLAYTSTLLQTPICLESGVEITPPYFSSAVPSEVPTEQANSYYHSKYLSGPNPTDPYLKDFMGCCLNILGWQGDVAKWMQGVALKLLGESNGEDRRYGEHMKEQWVAFMDRARAVRVTKGFFDRFGGKGASLKVLLDAEVDKQGFTTNRLTLEREEQKVEEGKERG